MTIWPLYVSLMSARLFHSRDIDGLREALTEPPASPPGKEAPTQRL